MKKINLLIIGIIMTTGIANANIKKGQQIYLKKLKAPCEMSGVDFAHKHTQDEWENIFEAGKMKEELQKICPKAKINEKWLEDVYDFSYEYASDSGNVPSC